MTGLRYDVFTDRARPRVAVVRLQLTPHWSGTATVTDLLDGTPATLTTGVSKGWIPAARQDWETVETQGTNLVAGLASRVGLSSNAANAIDTPVSGGSQSAGQRLAFAVTAGQSYTVTKYVGVASGTGIAAPVSAGSPAAVGAESAADAAAARQQSDAAAAAGFGGLSTENAAAWQALWAGNIDVLGNSYRYRTGDH